MKYTVNTQGSKYFQVIDERGEPLGAMEYKGWTANNAIVTTNDGNIYKIERTGFWLQNINVYKNEAPYLTLKVRMGFGLEIAFENGPALSFKKKSIWNNEDVLMDDTDTVIAHVYSWFKWSKLNFHYELEVDTPMRDREADKFLPFLLIYCSRFLRMRRAAA